MKYAFPTVLLAFGILFVPACSRESRTEGRQRRLDTFRECLPDSIRESFDAISARDECGDVGVMLQEARVRSPALDAKLDSIIHAELIDTFTAEEIVCYFWVYFHQAIETGSVRGP